MEKVSNLHLLPSTGFQVICFPVKIRAASAVGPRSGCLALTNLRTLKLGVPA